MNKTLLSSVLFLAGTAAAQAFTLGASVGYLVDSEEAYYTVRGGYDFSTTPSLTQAVELEAGYMHDSGYGAKLNLVPITANYRATFAADRAVSYYAGAGLGAAITDFEYYGTERDTSLAAQTFGGVNFRLNPSLNVTVGARYLWIDSVNLYGSRVEVGDDVAIEAGLHWRF